MRISNEMLKKIDNEVNGGFYSSRSEFIRDCIRRCVEFESLEV